MNPLFQAKPLAGPPLPSIPAIYRDYPCPICGVTDWMIRPDGTMSCFHCLDHLTLSKRWLPCCGQIQG